MGLNAQQSLSTQQNLVIIGNQGQHSPEVLFHAKPLNGAQEEYFFTDDNEIALVRTEEIGGQTEDIVVRLDLVGDSSEAIVSGWEQQQGYVNFLQTNLEEDIVGVSTYRGVFYEDIYENIDRVVYENFGDIKTDYIVAPGGNPDLIQMDYSADSFDVELRIDEATGDLIVDFYRDGELFDLRVTDSAPIAFQRIDGQIVEVEVAYELLGGSVVGFALGEYNPEYELVIDPIVEYSTYLGGQNPNVATGDPPHSDVFEITTEVVDLGTGEIPGPFERIVTDINVQSFPGNDAGLAIAVDSAGSAYITGETLSVAFPTTVETEGDPDGGDFASNSTDAFITKLNADGTLAYSTYVGGADRDVAYGIAVDINGAAIIVGETESEGGFISNGGGEGFGGGASDAFITRISPTGTEVDFSAFFGGMGSERALGIALDESSSAYVVGSTTSNSSSLAVSDTAFQADNNGGTDAFIVKFDADGAQIYSSYFGGVGFDEGTGVGVDSTGNAYISGTTESPNLATAGAAQDSFQGGSDAFVAKIGVDGDVLEYATYAGGSGFEITGGLDVGVDGTVYFTGITSSPDFTAEFIAENGALQEEFAGGSFDAFVTSIIPDGTDFNYSTFLGGSGNEGVNFLPQTSSNLVVDRAGSVHLVGTTTSSTDFPTLTPGEEPRPYGGGPTDGFITKIDPEGERLIYSTYWGGSGRDEGYGIALDNNGAAYITGLTIGTNTPGTGGEDFQTNPNDFPTTAGVFQELDPSPRYDFPIEQFESTDIGIEVIGGEVVPAREDAFVSKFAFEGVVITEFGGDINIREGGGPGEFSLVLTTQPQDEVTIALSPDIESETDVDQIEFNQDTWNIPRIVTVTAVDDDLVEGDHTSTILLTAVSTDENYNEIPIGSVVANITDNDATVLVNEPVIGLEIEEGGATDSFSLALSSAPEAEVTIEIISDDEAIAEPTSLTFTPGNFNIPQVVTIAAVNDTDIEGPHISTISFMAISADSNYDGISIPSVTAEVVDNDPAEVIVTQTAASTNITEGGATDNISIVLNRPPTNNVTVTIITDDQSTANRETIVFTPENATIPVAVVIQAEDDVTIEGEHSSTIDFEVTSEDPDFDGLAIESVLATITDNDGAEIDIDLSGTVSVTEGGEPDTFTVVLPSQPTADVTITIETDEETTVSPSTLIFTPENFNEPQEVEVIAVNDPADAGDDTSIITLTAASEDTNYNEVTSTITAEVIDNTEGVGISTGDGIELFEDGAADSYEIVLASPPTAEVSIAVVVEDGQSVVSPNSLTFTPENFSIPQRVFVRAVDDEVGEGIHFTTIEHIATSEDLNYQGNNAEFFIDGVETNTIEAQITDNDTGDDPTPGDPRLIIEENGLDIDGDGQTRGRTDGVLFVRYLLGIRGDRLINDAIGEGAVRNTAEEVEDYLDLASTIGFTVNGVTSTLLDVDGSGLQRARNDGRLALRYLFGLTGNALIRDIEFEADAQRTSATAIENFLREFDPDPLPGSVGSGNRNNANRNPGTNPGTNGLGATITGLPGASDLFILPTDIPPIIQGFEVGLDVIGLQGGLTPDTVNAIAVEGGTELRNNGAVLALIEDLTPQQLNDISFSVVA